MLRFLTAGESHGPALVAILEGMPAGILLDTSVINHELARRQGGFGAGPRMKLEHDKVQILGGLMDGRTTGAPLALTILNLDHSKWRGMPIAPMTTPRPGHADLTGAMKYSFNDFRLALERSSARETAARVAIGAICKQFLTQFNILVGGYVIAIGKVSATINDIPYTERFSRAEDSDVRCPDVTSSQLMQDQIKLAIEKKDTLGGLLEIIALSVPPGLGSYSEWDKRLDGRLGAALLSVQAIKGVEIGSAFENASLPGTQVHDPINLSCHDLYRPTNRAGGIEGGVSNGQPIILRAAMKPIATTLTPQTSVDFATGTEATTQYERSDFCPVPRCVPILESMVSFILADALIEKLGGDSMDEMLPRFEMLHQARLDDFHMDQRERIWWPE